MPLTDRDIRGLQPASKKYRRSVGGNLYIEIRPLTTKKDGSKGGGGKYWMWNYGFPIGSKPTRWYSIGTYGKESEGKWSLRKARDERNRLEILRKEGQDPRTLKSSEKMANQGTGAYTLRDVAKEWMGYQRKVNKKSTVDDYENKLNNQILPTFGNKLIKNITREECIEFKKFHQDRGKIAQAKKLFRTLRQVFAYAIEYEWIPDNNPAVESKFTQVKYKEKHQPALLHWNEVPPFLKDLSENKCNGEFITNASVKILLLTFVRVNEILPAEWTEIDWKKKIWTIPAERMKGGNEHLIPMSAPLIEILERIKALNWNSPYVFANFQGKANPWLQKDSPNKHIRNLGYGGRLVAHGVRRMAATHGQEQLGFAYDIIHLQSGRLISKDKVRRAYDAAQFIPERTDFMDKWGDLLVANGLII